MRNIRDIERDMGIYRARKIDKRTYADIGQEYGIGPERVRQVYRRMDWELNGYNADHHQKKPKPKMGKIIPFPNASETQN